MARADLLNILYTRTMSALDFHFESLVGPSIYEFLEPYDIRYMKSITSHPKLASKIKEKTKLLTEVMEAHNFKKMAQGTNRICFKHFCDERIVAKVALDDVGLKDNPAEYKNQNILKPFITKVFDVSEFGEASTFERVEPITSREQFLSIAGDAFDLLNTHIHGEYVLDDVGSDYFLNYGIRKGFGPVLLDFPYVYKIDGRKLICNKRDEMSPTGYCMGEIDYDIGFNNIVCTKCGKRYFAIDLKKDEKENKIIVEKKEGGIPMKITIKRGEEVLKEKEIGKNIRQVNFVPTKSTVKISYEGGERKVEEVKQTEELVETAVDTENTTVINVKPEYPDYSERKPKHFSRGGKKKNKNKDYNKNNNGNGNNKYPGKNSPEYYSRGQNRSSYNNNTSVNDSPKLNENIYKSQVSIDEF